MTGRKKISFVFTAAIAVVMLFSVPASAVRIKIATKAPENFKSAQIVKKMTKEIEEKTDGKVRFKIYYGGVKGGGRDLLLKMKGGEIHGGEFMASELYTLSRDLQLMGIPLAFKDYEEVDHVFDKLTGRINEQMEKRGYVVLGWIEVGFAYIMSVEPIGSMADLKGKKAWIPEGDRISQAFFESLGVSPIPMTIADAMLALQTGQIDTVANSFMGAIALQWHTKIKYVTDMPLLYTYGLLMITKDSYDRIPAEHKKTVHKVVDRYLAEIKADIRKNNIDSAKTLSRLGIKFVPVSAEHRGDIRRAVEEVNERLTGTEYPRDGVLEMRRHLKEYRKTGSAGK